MSMPSIKYVSVDGASRGVEGTIFNGSNSNLLKHEAKILGISARKGSKAILSAVATAKKYDPLLLISK